jgi:two-component sensor histidine kinase
VSPLSPPEPFQPEAVPPGYDEGELKILELRHRMKNVLAVVQSLAQQTLRPGRPMEEAREALSGRLVAIGHAVDLLLHNAWTPAPLEALIQAALVHGGEQVRLEGPHVSIAADAAMALTLVFHELESNAIKYGALSRHDGEVAVAWTIANGEPGAERLALEWREQGGPEVARPDRRGFGSRMISNMIAQRFEASAEADYRRDGLVWRFSAPMRLIAA